jgi:hypothetical protein
MSSALVMGGSAVKTKTLAGARGLIEGYSIRFSEPPDVDCEGDYFPEDVDLGLKYLNPECGMPLQVDHGHGELGKMVVTDLSFRRDKRGLFVSGEIDLNDPIRKKLFEWAQSGTVNWSTSSLWQNIRKVKEKFGDKSVNRIVQWYPRESSITARGCDARTEARATLSLKNFRPAVSLTESLQMSVSERLEFERAKTRVHLQNLLDEGGELSPDVIRRFGLLSNSWLQNQAGVYARNQADRSCLCHQSKVAGLESTQQERFQPSERGRRGRMRIPCGW